MGAATLTADAVASGSDNMGSMDTMDISSPPFEPVVASGDVIAGLYEVRDLIGYGAVGFVVSARDLSNGDEVAIKLLRPECSDSEAAVRRFRIDATTLAGISSERIVSVFAVDALADGTPFMVMERLRGTDLSRLLAAQGPLSIERAVAYVLQACEGLAAAHAAGVRHFDLKPANLFVVDEDGLGEQVKLIDFGVSGGRVHSLENCCTGDTLIGIGSPFYMSPERRRGEPSDDRSDIWSLGCVLYELLAGKPLMRRGADASSAQSSIIVDEAALGPCLSCPGVPPRLEAVIRRCVAPQASARFGDVAELAAALMPFAAEDNSSASEHCWQSLHGQESAVLTEGGETPEQRLFSREAPAASEAWPYDSSSTFVVSPAKPWYAKLALVLLVTAGLLAYSAYASTLRATQFAPASVLAPPVTVGMAEVSTAAASPAAAPGSAVGTRMK